MKTTNRNQPRPIALPLERAKKPSETEAKVKTLRDHLFEVHQLRNESAMNNRKIVEKGLKELGYAPKVNLNTKRKSGTSHITWIGADASQPPVSLAYHQGVITLAPKTLHEILTTALSLPK